MTLKKTFQNNNIIKIPFHPTSPKIIKTIGSNGIGNAISFADFHNLFLFF